MKSHYIDSMYTGVGEMLDILSSLRQDGEESSVQLLKGLRLIIPHNYIYT